MRVRVQRWKLRRTLTLTVVMVALLALLTGCGSDDDEPVAADEGSEAEGGAETTEPAASAEPVTLRLGYFPNVTHAPAIIGVDEGLFEDALDDNVSLETTTFNAGPEAVEALFADALDITYIGPNPAINAFAQSNGEAVRIIAGSTSGGAFLVVRPGIDSPEDLRGTSIATPQLGNTQDVAFRSWLADEGMSSDTSGGGDVSIVPQANADSLTQFQEEAIDGAWVPEPWATRMIQEGGGEVLVDERDLWPDGRFVTTHVIVRTEFLEEHPDVVRSFLVGHVRSVAFAAEQATEAQAIVNAGIEAVTTKALPEPVITAAWENLEFTDDPIASSLAESAADAESVGLLEPVDLDGIYDLTLLNEVLVDAGRDEVEGL